MDNLAPYVLAEAAHEKLREEVPVDAFGDEMSLPWVELEQPYRDAYARMFEDLIDRDLIDLAPAGERATERHRASTPGIV